MKQLSPIYNEQLEIKKINYLSFPFCMLIQNLRDMREFNLATKL